jgi:hypothetical protein
MKEKQDEMQTEIMKKITENEMNSVSKCKELENYIMNLHNEIET